MSIEQLQQLQKSFAEALGLSIDSNGFNLKIAKELSPPLTKIQKKDACEIMSTLKDRKVSMYSGERSLPAIYHLLDSEHPAIAANKDILLEIKEALKVGLGLRPVGIVYFMFQRKVGVEMFSGNAEPYTPYNPKFHDISSGLRHRWITLYKEDFGCFTKPIEIRSFPQACLIAARGANCLDETIYYTPKLKQDIERNTGVVLNNVAQSTFDALKYIAASIQTSGAKNLGLSEELAEGYTLACQNGCAYIKSQFKLNDKAADKSAQASIT